MSYTKKYKMLFRKKKKKKGRKRFELQIHFYQV